MRNENNETQEPSLDAATVISIARHYCHAKDKHPYFADRLCEFGSFGGPCERAAEAARAKLEKWREGLAQYAAVGIVPAIMLVEVEVLELVEALARSDNAAAVEECYDVIAVMLRIIDVLEGRQELGRPKTAESEAK